jgi:hypothetical protein
MLESPRGRIFRYPPPKKKRTTPLLRPTRRVCVFGPREASIFREAPYLTHCEGKKCKHHHRDRKSAEKEVADGRLEWLDANHAIAAAPEHREWHKVKGQNGRGNSMVAAMQMRRGGEMRVRRYVEGGLVSPR